jgi:signal transduction histidine kinase
VLDNGPGVAEDHRERIFERFYQVDLSRSGGEGTGLGLAICKHIVEAHGGRIWAESNANGGGGKFLFTLPGVTEPLPGAEVSKFE